MADEAGKVPDKVDEDGNGDSGVPQVAGLGTGEAEGATTSAQADAGGEPAAKGVSNDDPIEGTDEYGGEVLEGSMGAESLRSKMYTLQQKELNAVRL